MVLCRLQRAKYGSLQVAASRNGSLQVTASRNGSLQVTASRNGSLQVTASRNSSLQVAASQIWFSAGCSELKMVLCRLHFRIFILQKCLYIFVYGVNQESKQIP